MFQEAYSEKKTVFYYIWNSNDRIIISANCFTGSRILGSNLINCIYWQWKFIGLWRWKFSLRKIYFDSTLNSAHFVVVTQLKQRTPKHIRECLIIDFRSSLKFPFDRLKSLFTTSTMRSCEPSLAYVIAECRNT